jgi:hypothetical protein
MAYDNIYYDIISPSYIDIINQELTGKNIIFSHQYIRDIDNDFDREYGFINTWIIGIICIEKTVTDYIFHMFESDTRSSGAEPHYIEKFITFPHKQIVKLSEIISKDLKYNRLFELYYMTAKESKDKILINKIKKII